MNFIRKWLKPAPQQEPPVADADRSSYRVSVMHDQESEDSSSVATSSAYLGEEPTDSSIFDTTAGTGEKSQLDVTARRRTLVLVGDSPPGSEKNKGYDPYDTGRFGDETVPPYDPRK